MKYLITFDTLTKSFKVIQGSDMIENYYHRDLIYNDSKFAEYVCEVLNKKLTEIWRK